MATYLGEFPIDPTSESGRALPSSPSEWALYVIERYGQIDGAHHKQWVLDQVARILNDAPVSVVEARWDGGQCELRESVGTSPEYEAWVEAMKGDGEYDYDEGIAP